LRGAHRGDDTIYARNGEVDAIVCEDGTDTVSPDPLEEFPDESCFVTGGKVGHGRSLRAGNDETIAGADSPLIHSTRNNTSYTILAQSPCITLQGTIDTHNSSVYQAPSGVWVFASGTNHWCNGLGKPGVVDARIKRATANILNRFLISAPPGDQVPATPSALSATVVFASQIGLSWKDNATREGAYAVERSLVGSTGWTELTSTLPADTTIYSDTGLNAGTTYCCRVKATNANGSSGHTNVASATPSAAVYVFTDDWSGADRGGVEQGQVDHRRRHRRHDGHPVKPRQDALRERLRRKGNGYRYHAPEGKYGGLDVLPLLLY
jgi:Fibronectin type III domain